eukprot:4733096-Alexandrium_andersonii.AAC.1
MSASLVGSEMCIRDSLSSIRTGGDAAAIGQQQCNSRRAIAAHASMTRCGAICEAPRHSRHLGPSIPEAHSWE